MTLRNQLIGACVASVSLLCIPGLAIANWEPLDAISTSAELRSPSPLRLDVTLTYGKQRVVLAGVVLGSTTGSKVGIVSAPLRRALGPWSRCRREETITSLEWTRLGLRVDFQNLGQAPRCALHIDGWVSYVSLSGAGASRWLVHTGRGDLRVGMRSTAIPRALRRTARFSTDPEPSTALFWPGQDECGRARAVTHPDLLNSALSAWMFDGRIYQISSVLRTKEGLECS